MYQFIIGSHIAFALASVGLGTFVLSMRKGTPRHKLMGRIWVVMMTVVAVGSFSIRDLEDGGFSFIHGISAFTLCAMVYAVVMIRRGKRPAHLRAMIGCFIGSLVAGALALDPNRLIGRFLFGG